MIIPTQKIWRPLTGGGREACYLIGGKVVPMTNVMFWEHFTGFAVIYNHTSGLIFPDDYEMTLFRMHFNV